MAEVSQDLQSKSAYFRSLHFLFSLPHSTRRKRCYSITDDRQHFKLKVMVQWSRGCQRQSFSGD